MQTLERLCDLRQTYGPFALAPNDVYATWPEAVRAARKRPPASAIAVRGNAHLFGDVIPLHMIHALDAVLRAEEALAGGGVQAEPS
jgi:hypothetical protein